MPRTTGRPLSHVAPRAGRPGAVIGVITAAAAVALLPVSPAAAASTPVTPSFTCAAANTDGSYTLFFSYTNSSSATFVLGPSIRNDVTPASSGAVPPSTFEPGTHAAFTLTTTNGSVKWRLDGATADGDTSTLCSGQAVVAESWSPLLLPAAAIVPFGVWFGRSRRRQRLSPAL